MRKYLLFFVAVILIDCRGKSQSTSTDSTLVIPEHFTHSQVSTVVEYIDPFPDNTQLSIAVIHDTTTSFFGIIKVNDTLHNIENAHAAFEIGSITKVFTSTLLCQYVIQGLVNLNDPIQKYLPFTLNKREAKAHTITLKHLANHTSGLPRLPEDFGATITNPENPYQDYNKEKLEKYLQEDVKLHHSPGEQHEYSNVGVGILGYILSNVTGQAYAALLQENIFMPLNMLNTSIGSENLHTKLVTGRDASGNPTMNWDLNALQGAGAILSTSEDLAKFLKANLKENAVYELQQKKTFSIDQHMDIALGWHIMHTAEGKRWYWHNGGTGGYRSCLALNMNTKKAIVILSNVSAFHRNAENIDQLCFSLMKSIDN